MTDIHVPIAMFSFFKFHDFFSKYLLATIFPLLIIDQFTLLVMFQKVGYGDSLGLDSRVWAQGRFGFRLSGLGFCRVFTLSYITNWGSGLVPVYFKKSGSGPVRIFAGFLETRYITNYTCIC